MDFSYILYGIIQCNVPYNMYISQAMKPIIIPKVVFIDTYFLNKQ